ncbi:MAG: helix-turn-helix domain-containing protein [Mycobacteriales bacterium]
MAGSDTLAGRLPDLAGLFRNLDERERRELEDAFLRVLALSQRSRPLALPDEIPAVQPEQVAVARARNLQRATEARADLIAEALSTAEVASMLGVSSAAVTKRRTKGDLVAFRHAGDWRYPRWQFDDGEPRADVRRVWRAMPGRVAVGRVRWFTLPSRHLDDRTPLAALDAGEADRVADAATYIGAR